MLLLHAGTQARVQAQVPGSRDTNFVLVAGTDVAPIRLAFAPDSKVYVGGTFTNYGGTGRASLARLNRDGTVDTTFRLGPLRDVQPAVILNGQVLVPASTNLGSLDAVTVRSDGKVALAGDFNRVGATPVNQFALLESDGTPAPFTPDVGTAEIHALMPAPEANLWVAGGGSLDPTSTDARTGRLVVARLRPDGSRDPGFVTPRLAQLGYASANGYALHRGPGGTVYVFVAAATTNFQPAFAVLRLTPSGSLDTTFAEGGRAAANGLQQMFAASAPDGTLYLSGTLNWRGSAITRRVNRLTPDGAIDPTFVAGAQGQFAAAGIAIQPDGRPLLINAGAAPVIRLNLNGTIDTAYANAATTPVAASISPLVIAAGPDGAAYCAGFLFSGGLINGVFRIHGDPSTAPTVATQPRSQTNTLGARTRFVMSAQGLAPIAHQWRRNGTPIPGATGAELILDPTFAADDAEFDCVVSNSLGSATTQPARLTLLPATAGAPHLETDVPPGTDGGVRDLQHAGPGQIWVAGSFNRIHGTPARALARLTDVGSRVDPGFDSTRVTLSLGVPEQVVPLPDGRALLAHNGAITTSGRTFMGSVRFQADGSLDPAWHASGTGGSGSINRFARLDDGRLLVADTLWNATPLPSGIARLSSDGLRDATFQPPAYTAIQITPAPLPDGGALVAGRTASGTAIPGQLSSGVLKLLPNGALDPTFHTGPHPGLTSASVAQILRLDDGRILVAGDFMLDAGTGAHRVAVLRLLPNGQPDPAFNAVPILSRTDSPAQRIAVQADGRILIVTRSGTVVRLWPQGAADPDFTLGRATRSGRSTELGALLVTRDNDILLGGDFDSYNGLPRTNLVRVSAGPLLPAPPAPGLGSVPTRTVGSVGQPITLEAVPTGEGPFQYQWRRNQRTGSSVFREIAGATNATLALPNPRVEDSGIYQVAILNPGGTVFSPLLTVLIRPDPPVPGTPDAAFVTAAFRGILSGQHQVAEPAPDGSLHASFGTALAHLLEDGTPDPAFRSDPALFSGPNPDFGIAAVRRQPDGRILVAGRFGHGAVARLLPNGDLDPTFVRTNSYTGNFQNVPWAIGLQSDGRILVAGTFENFAGRDLPGLVRLHPDGRLDEAFLARPTASLSNPPRTVPGGVIQLHVLPDDRIYIGGAFTHVNSIARAGVARLLPDGSVDGTFVPPAAGNVGLGDSGAFTFYSAGPVTPTGGIHLFGRFQIAPDGPIYAALRLNPDGSVDDTFRVTTDFAINFGAVQPDGKLVVAGQFTRLNGSLRSGFARLNTDGSTDTTFSEALSFGVGVPLVGLADGNLLAGHQRVLTGSGPAPQVGTVQFTLQQGNLLLAWPEGYVLQRTTQLVPAVWTEVAAPSPFTVPMAQPGEFFRVLRRP